MKWSLFILILLVSLMSSSLEAQVSGVETQQPDPEPTGIGVTAVREGMEQAHEDLFGSTVDATSIVLELDAAVAAPGTFNGLNQAGQPFSLLVDLAITTDVAAMEFSNPQAYQTILANQYRETRIRGQISTPLASLPITGHTIDWVDPQLGPQSYFILAGHPSLYWVISVDEFPSLPALAIAGSGGGSDSGDGEDLPGPSSPGDDDDGGGGITHGLQVSCFASTWVDVADDPICEMIMELYEGLLDELASDLADAKSALTAQFEQDKAAAVNELSATIDSALDRYDERIGAISGAYHLTPSGGNFGPMGGSGFELERYNQQSADTNLLLSETIAGAAVLENALNELQAEYDLAVAAMDALAESFLETLTEDRNAALELFGCDPQYCNSLACVFSFYGLDEEGALVYSYGVWTYSETCE